MHEVGELDEIKNIDYIRRGMAELKASQKLRVYPTVMSNFLTDLGLGIRPNPRVHVQNQPSVYVGNSGM